MKSPEHENYYDNKFYIFNELKMEVTDTEVPHSDCNVNNEIVSEDMQLSKFNVQNKIKHETTENRLPLNVTIKIEHMVEEEIMDNNENMSVPYRLTVPDAKRNSDERLLKDNVNLLKPDNEQSNMQRVAELNELHKCKHCNIHFDHCDDMLVHISLVHNEKTFKCELCGKQLNTLSSLKRHIILLHEHKQPLKDAKTVFKCINCNAEFNNRLTLNDHAKLSQKDEEIIAYKCDSCDDVYKSEQNMRDHVKRVHTNKEHKCNCFSTVFMKNQCSTNHMKNVHYDYGRTLDCCCGKQFPSPLRLSSHKLQCHKLKIKDMIRCDSCQKIFKTKGSLDRHIKRFHYEYGRTFNCWCGKQFRSPEYLRLHKRRLHERTDNGRFQCDSCQKIFKKRQFIVKHIQRVHYDYGRTFSCWCGKQFRSPINLSCHRQQCHKREIKDRFQCDSCQNIFKTKGTLVRHIKRFHYEYGRAFDCWCGKQFRSPEYLRYHNRRQHERSRSSVTAVKSVLKTN